MPDPTNSYYNSRRHQWETELNVHEVEEGTWNFIFKEIMSLHQPMPGARVLDLGCGEGQIVGMMRDIGLEADGLDFSERLVLKARRNAPAARIYHQSFLDPFPDGPYDYIFSYSVIQYCRPSDMEKMIGNCADALKPGGKAIHFAVPDLDRMYAADGVYFRLESEEEFRQYRMGLASLFAAGESPFPDGTMFHSIPLMTSQARNAGLDCRHIPVSYRSHVVMTKVQSS